MRQLVHHGPRDLRLDDVPEPPPRDGIAVDVHLAALTLGSELAVYRGRAGVRYPRIAGYEAVGRTRDGQRVVLTAGCTEVAVRARERLVPIPDDIPDELAILLINACDAAVGVRRCTPGPADRAVVTGAGAMGLMAVLALLEAGVPEITVVEPISERRHIAVALGATHAVAPGSVDQGFTVGIECSDAPVAFTEIQQAMAPRGRVCVLADGNGPPLTLGPAFYDRELAVFGSTDHPEYPAYAPRFFPRLPALAEALQPLVADRCRLEELPGRLDALGEPRLPLKLLCDVAL